MDVDDVEDDVGVDGNNFWMLRRHSCMVGYVRGNSKAANTDNGDNNTTPNVYYNSRSYFLYLLLNCTNNDPTLRLTYGSFQQIPGVKVTVIKDRAHSFRFSRSKWSKWDKKLGLWHRNYAKLYCTVFYPCVTRASISIVILRFFIQFCDDLLGYIVSL